MSNSTEQSEESEDDLPGEDPDNNQQTHQFEWDLTAPRLVWGIVLLTIIWLFLFVFVSRDIAGQFISGLTPLIIVVLGYVFDQRLREIERKHAERIEFTIDANFYGPKRDAFLGEFLISVHNKSLVKHKSEKITLEVLGLERGETPTEWPGGREGELEFPHKLIDEVNIIPEKMSPIFVEPNVNQPITYTSPIDEKYDYLLATAKFNYIDKPQEKGFKPHTVQRVFALESTGDS